MILTRSVDIDHPPERVRRIFQRRDLVDHPRRSKVACDRIRAAGVNVLDHLIHRLFFGDVDPPILQDCTPCLCELLRCGPFPSIGRFRDIKAVYVRRLALNGGDSDHEAQTASTASYDDGFAKERKEVGALGTRQTCLSACLALGHTRQLVILSELGRYRLVGDRPRVSRLGSLADKLLPRICEWQVHSLRGSWSWCGTVITVNTDEQGPFTPADLICSLNRHHSCISGIEQSCRVACRAAHLASQGE